MADGEVTGEYYEEGVAADWVPEGEGGVGAIEDVAAEFDPLAFAQDDQGGVSSPLFAVLPDPKKANQAAASLKQALPLPSDLMTSPVNTPEPDAFAVANAKINPAPVPLAQSKEMNLSLSDFSPLEGSVDLKSFAQGQKGSSDRVIAPYENGQVVSTYDGKTKTYGAEFRLNNTTGRSETSVPFASHLKAPLSAETLNKQDSPEFSKLKAAVKMANSSSNVQATVTAANPNAKAPERGPERSDNPFFNGVAGLGTSLYGMVTGLPSMVATAFNNGVAVPIAAGVIKAQGGIVPTDLRFSGTVGRDARTATEERVGGLVNVPLMALKDGIAQKTGVVADSHSLSFKLGGFAGSVAGIGGVQSAVRTRFNETLGPQNWRVEITPAPASAAPSGMASQKGTVAVARGADGTFAPVTGNIVDVSPTGATASANGRLPTGRASAAPVGAQQAASSAQSGTTSGLASLRRLTPQESALSQASRAVTGAKTPLQQVGALWQQASSLGNGAVKNVQGALANPRAAVQNAWNETAQGAQNLINALTGGGNPPSGSSPALATQGADTSAQGGGLFGNLGRNLSQTGESASNLNPSFVKSQGTGGGRPDLNSSQKDTLQRIIDSGDTMSNIVTAATYDKFIDSLVTSIYGKTSTRISEGGAEEARAVVDAFNVQNLLTRENFDVKFQNQLRTDSRFFKTC
jgi:hypothetical protein